MIAQETIFLIQKLRDVLPGETIFYSDLSAAVGGADVRKPRTKLASAIKIVRRDYGLIFVAIADVGYQLMKQEDVSVMAEIKGLSETKRVVSRWESRLDTVDYGALPDASKTRYVQSCTKLAIVSASTSDEMFQVAKSQINPKGQFKPTKEDVLAAIAYGVS